MKDLRNKVCALCWGVFVSSCLLSLDTHAQDRAAKQSKKLEEISIYGNTELPTLEFNLPWKLPTIAKRSEEKPVTELEGMLEPIEPKRHRQRVFFNQYLELELPNYTK